MGTGKLFSRERVSRDKLPAEIDRLIYKEKMGGYFANTSHWLHTPKERVFYNITKRSRHPAYPAIIRWRVVLDRGKKIVVIDGHYAGDARAYFLWLQKHKADLMEGKRIILNWRGPQ